MPIGVVLRYRNARVGAGGTIDDHQYIDEPVALPPALFRQNLSWQQLLHDEAEFNLLLVVGLKRCWKPCSAGQKIMISDNARSICMQLVSLPEWKGEILLCNDADLNMTCITH